MLESFRLAEVTDSAYKKSLLVVFLSLAICGYYLPWKWTSFALLPLYLFAWIEKDNYQIERKLKLVFWSFIAYAVFFSLTSYVPKLSAKGVYDVLRGLFLFPVGMAFALWVADKRSWAQVNFVSLLLVLGSLFFPQRGGSFFSYFENPNNAAVLLIIFICFQVPAVNDGRPGRLNIFSMVGMPVALYLLFLTNGRGAWLGLAVATAVILLFRNRLSVKTRLIACCIPVATLSLLIFKYNVKGFQLSLREGLWYGLLTETVQKNIFLGYGFNGTKVLIDELGLITRTAHNIFLEIFVTSGLLGLFYVLLLMYFVWRIFSNYSYPNNHLVVSGLIAIISFMIMGQFDLKFSSFRFVGTMAFFLGMIYSQRVDKQDENVFCCR